MPKFSVGGESFSVSLVSGIEKFYVAEGYVTLFDFLSKFFCLTVPKSFVGEPFCAVFQKKFMDKRGEYQDFPSKIFCLTVPKISERGESFSVSLFSGIEKVWIRGGGEYQGFPSKIFCLTLPKVFVGGPFRVSLIPSFEKG